MIACTLAKEYDPKRIKSWGDVWVSPKLDGIRARYHQGVFYSRDDKVWNSAVVSHLLPTLSQWPQDLILDGEFYCHGLSLQEINSAIAVKRIAPTDVTPQISYCVFDVQMPTPFSQRLFLLRRMPTSYRVNIVDQFQCASTIDIDHYHNLFINTGYEGSMVRNNEPTYSGNRTFHLMKLKDFLEDDFHVVGFDEGEGKYQSTLGAIVCLTSHNRIFRVGTGMIDSTRNYIWANREMYMNTLLKVKYQCLSSDGIPRHPVFISFC